MGYNLTITHSDFIVKAEHLDAAYTALCELNRSERGKNRCTQFDNPGEILTRSSSVSTNPNLYFPWMTWNYDEVYGTAQEILENLGFETEIDENGDLFLMFFDGKSGVEEMFLEALAPFSSGSIQWLGEEDERWMNVVEDGAIATYYPVVTWVKG